MPASVETDGRPSPDALLVQARREEKGRVGRLKIFVGAAPGVGKTYEMLVAAHAKQKEGVDVVAGIVETHGREETEVLLKGLTVLPRKAVSYGNRTLREFDLEAALERRPDLILVDELAHTNVAGSRHPKRYQDVEELLDAGIDVYSTVNIQHIESLNDVVAQITRVRVREIVPDSIFDRADAIELVDLTPEDLIQRLKEGRVYVPKQAERALQHYFSPANLTALRELALRRTAERVDEQLLEQMRARAISGPWAAGERLLVCINEDPRSAGLVRYAKRLADRLHAPWTALYIETMRSLDFDERDRDTIAETLRLAERLEGDAISMPAVSRRVADDVLAYARRSNVTHIIIGKSVRSRWFEILHGSIVHDLVRRAGNISVHVIAGDTAAVSSQTRAPVQTDATQPFDAIPYAFALMAVAAALGISLLVAPLIGVNVDLIFLTAVVGVAVRYGLWPSLTASLAASLCFNFFFLQPAHTLEITDPANIAAFVMFTALAVLISRLAARGWRHTISAQERVRVVESLYGFSRKLASAGALDDVLWATAYQIALLLKVRVVLLLPDDGSIAVKAGYPPEDALDEADLAAAKWAWQKGQPAGRDSDTLPGAKWLFMPMRTGRGAIGIVGISREGGGALLQADQRRLLDALIDQGALAIERVHLVEDFDRIKRTAETERLRSALLTSISHDLKTPLASILGAAGALRDLPQSFDEAAKSDLLMTVVEESERLNRFIANLLDMTKLESGAITPSTAAYDVSEIIGSALERSAKILSSHDVKVEISPDLPMITVDAVLFEQALFNLLDNAAKYAPTGTTVFIRSWADNNTIKLQIMDEGDGIPDADLERIFDKFYRARKGDHVRAGTGLGLSISRGFIEALNGTISASNRTDRSGAIFTIVLPASQIDREVVA